MKRVLAITALALMFGTRATVAEAFTYFGTLGSVDPGPFLAGGALGYFTE